MNDFNIRIIVLKTAGYLYSNPRGMLHFAFFSSSLEERELSSLHKEHVKFLKEYTAVVHASLSTFRNTDV